jgi:Bacteriophage Sf6, terminase small subunit-like
MSQDWLVAMGIDVRYPQGLGERSLVGHRLLLALRGGSKSGRELHAALGRKVPAAERRAALAELRSAGLLSVTMTPSGPRGGRPRATWTLLYPSSSAIRVAEQAVLAAATSRPRKRRETPWRAPTLNDLRRAGLMPPEGGRRRRRRLKPVPEEVADDILEWIAFGGYLRDFCRRPGTPATRTVYAWAKKDPDFRRRFQQAREFGVLGDN